MKSEVAVKRIFLRRERMEVMYAWKIAHCAEFSKHCVKTCRYYRCTCYWQCV